MPASAKHAVHAREPDLERERDVVGEHERRRAGAALAAVDREEVDAAVRRRPSSRARSRKNDSSPTADLIADGQPGAVGEQLDEVEQAVGVVERRVRPAG